MKKRVISAVLIAGCLLALLAGCANREKEVVGSCAGYDVLYEEMRFVALSERKSKSGAELERAVAEQIAADYAVLTAAKEFFPDLTIDAAEIQQAVDAAVEEAIESYGGKKEYKAFLKENNLTENYARLLLARAEIELKWKERLEAELFTGTELETETAFSAWLKSGNLVRVRRIVAESEATAQAILAELKAGKTPEEATNGKSGASLSARFYLVRGYSDDELLEADAFALTAEAPIGEIRQTETGYRVLILEEADFESFATYQLSTYFRNMRNEKYEAASASRLAAAAAANPFVPNEVGSSIDLENMK